MDQFNNTYLFKERRNFLKQRKIAFVLVIICTLLLIIAIFLISFSGTIVDYFLEIGIVNQGVGLWLVSIGKYTIAFLLFYFVIAFLYYFGPAKRKRWKFFSAGSSVATVFLILTTLAFGYYVKNLSQYNKIYGSIGTIMIVMLWFQLNAIIMLIGFELNAAISKAKETARGVIKEAS
jgi:membrane protein